MKVGNTNSKYSKYSMLHNFMTSRLRRLVRVCLAVISLTAFSHRIFKHKTIDKIFHVMFVFVHNPPIFPVLLTYSLKINSSLVLTHAVYTGRPTASYRRRGVTGSRGHGSDHTRRSVAEQPCSMPAVYDVRRLLKQF